MASLEQRRAKFALEKIEELKKPGANEEDLPKFKSQLLKLPARLHTNGLGQTVAFYLAAGPGKPEDVICTWLETWLHHAGILELTRLCKAPHSRVYAEFGTMRGAIDPVASSGF